MLPHYIICVSFLNVLLKRIPLLIYNDKITSSICDGTQQNIYMWWCLSLAKIKLVLSKFVGCNVTEIIIYVFPISPLYARACVLLCYYCLRVYRRIPRTAARSRKLIHHHAPRMCVVQHGIYVKLCFYTICALRFSVSLNEHCICVCVCVCVLCYSIYIEEMQNVHLWSL